MMPSDWLVDTNILVQVCRASPLGRHVIEERQLRAREQTPLISVVTVGEMFALARKFGWAEPKRAYMHEILADLVIVDINREAILEKYAEIDAWCHAQGIKPGKNDLWIAATASLTGATLLTTDKDFDPFHKVFLTREYFDPHGQYGADR